VSVQQISMMSMGHAIGYVLPLRMRGPHNRPPPTAPGTSSTYISMRPNARPPETPAPSPGAAAMRYRAAGNNGEEFQHDGSCNNDRMTV
jgi:hypothetical protein